jgi:thiamine biosynthesis lipoprotein
MTAMAMTVTSVPHRAAAAVWRRISTGDQAVAVAQRDALGTTARLAVWPPEHADAAMAAVDAVLAALDLQASRFRPDSEISWLNNSAGGLFMLSDGLAEAVGVALEAARWTGGLADPTVGEALISLGYDRDFMTIDPDSREPLPAPVPAPGWWQVQLDGPLLHLPAGLMLDLGATAKGLGSDRAARAILPATGHTGGALVSLGGDIATAGIPPRGGWPIIAAGQSGHDGADSPCTGPASTGLGQLVRLPHGAGRDLLDRLPQLAAGGAGHASHRGSADRAPGRRAMADSQRGRDDLRRCQRRRHRGDRGRWPGGELAGCGGPARAAGQPRRTGALPGRLARTGRRPNRGSAAELGTRLGGPTWRYAMSIGDITPASSGHLTLTGGPVPRQPVAAEAIKPVVAPWSSHPHRGGPPGGAR